MKCDRCNTPLEDNEKHEHLNLILCEDCYMEALSPLKTCDPWASYAAQSFEKHNHSALTLSPVQTKILDALKRSNGLEKEALLIELNHALTLEQLEREFAILKHMNRADAKKEGDRVLLVAC